MHQRISERKAAIAELCRRHGIARLEVFGSAARASDFDEALSDADFLVEFLGDSGNSPLAEFFDFRDSLAAVLGRPVDLIEPGALRNPYVILGVNQSRETVYAA